MSTYYAKSNKESTFELFNKRANYKSRSLFDAKTTPITDFGAEKYLYGRVNRRFVPIIAPSSRDYQFKTIVSAVNPQERLKAINFVVDAFEDMVQQFDKLYAVGQINTNVPFLSKLRAHKAYQDPKLRYQKYLKSYTNIFRSSTSKLAPENRITDFNVFEDLLMENMDQNDPNTPTTLAAYVKNRRNTLNTSGLVIEIATAPADNDDVKLAAFLSSPNWEVFKSAARNYGFIIDANVPWRLIANIKSDPMIEYAAEYGYNSVDEILQGYFVPAAEIEITTFANKMYNLYNLVKPDIIQYTEQINGKSYLKTVRPKNYKNIDVFRQHFNDDYMIELYCNMRFMEEETKLSDSEQLKLVRDTIELANVTSKQKAIRHFELFINKPFDYVGSLGYNLEKQRLQDDAEYLRESNPTTATTRY